MDWTVDHIQHHHLLKGVEYCSIQLRKKSNRFTVFYCNASWEYNHASYERQMELILLVKGEDEYPDDVMLQDLVNKCWYSMPNLTKQAWSEGAIYLNN